MLNVVSIINCQTRVPGNKLTQKDNADSGVVYYTDRRKAESPLSQRSWPVFVKTLYTLSVDAQTHLPKFSETSLNKGKERYKVNPWFICLKTRDSYALSLGS